MIDLELSIHSTTTMTTTMTMTTRMTMTTTSVAKGSEPEKVKSTGLRLKSELTNSGSIASNWRTMTTTTMTSTMCMSTTVATTTTRM